MITAGMAGWVSRGAPWAARLLGLLVLCAAPLLSGCWSADLTRGDFSKSGIKFEEAPIPLSASVAALEYKESGKSAEVVEFIISKSFLNALEESRVFQGVYTEAEAPDSDIKFTGTIRKVSIYENNWWMVLYVTTGIVTYGLAAGIEALCGVPYVSESATIRFDLRAVSRQSGAVIASYEIDWSDTQVYNIYVDRPTEEHYYLTPRVPIQQAMNEAVTKIAADAARYRAAAPVPKTPEPPPAPLPAPPPEKPPAQPPTPPPGQK